MTTASRLRLSIAPPHCIPVLFRHDNSCADCELITGRLHCLGKEGYEPIFCFRDAQRKGKSWCIRAHAIPGQQLSCHVCNVCPPSFDGVSLLLQAQIQVDTALITPPNMTAAALPGVSRQAAEFETISRLIAALLNEGYVNAELISCPTPTGNPNGAFLHNAVPDNGTVGRVWIALLSANTACFKDNHTFHPADFQTPVLVYKRLGDARNPYGPAEEASLETVVELLCTAAADEKAYWGEVLVELQNSAANQGTLFLYKPNIGLDRSANKSAAWFAQSIDVTRPNLSSSALQWEQALVTGHPSHPMHRTCLPQSPLQPILPSDLPSLVRPHIAIIAVDSASVRISGPFRTLLRPLMCKLDLPNVEAHEVLIPCLARQLPAIMVRFQSARVIARNAITASAQASIRTVVLPQTLQFEWHLKLALACTVTSALRTITPWTACVGPELSAVLSDLLPEDTWICREVASITGAQRDYDEAKHISCILRENHEARANAMNQTLVIAAALAETPYGETECYATFLFKLVTTEGKMDWLLKYTRKLLKATLLPALDSGICLEAHGQNILVRIEKSTCEIVGFVVRDLGGIKCYSPKLRQKGYVLTSALPGSFVSTDSEEEAWGIVQHTVIQNHIQHLIRRLHLEPVRAWSGVREQIRDLLAPREDHDDTTRFERFLFAPKVKNKAFLGMKLRSLYRDYEYTMVPNVLMTK